MAFNSLLRMSFLVRTRIVAQSLFFVVLFCQVLLAPLQLVEVVTLPL
jgi:hypothetical protein